MTRIPPVFPGAWLGVVGGGQLGRMFTTAAHRLGYRVAVLDPDRASPAGAIANEHLCADLDDPAASTALARRCAAVTIETENVPESSLRRLAAATQLRPGVPSVAITQDRVAEKSFIRACRLATVPWLEIKRHADLAGPRAQALLPGILKTARTGYDGRGQRQVATLAEARSAFAELGEVACVLERRVELAREISIVLARGADGSLAIYPSFENVHWGGVLMTSVAPAAIAPETEELARWAAERIARKLEHVGVLCVELFVDGEGRLLVNEIAPRPHNSAHLTIDAGGVSQFEQQVRTLAGLPLGEPALGAAAAMFNLLGDLWTEGEPHWEAVLAAAGARLHLYGKSDPRPGRKMGHVTCVAPTRSLALERITQLRALISRPNRLAA